MPDLSIAEAISMMREHNPVRVEELKYLPSGLARSSRWRDVPTLDSVEQTDAIPRAAKDAGEGPDGVAASEETEKRAASDAFESGHARGFAEGFEAGQSASKARLLEIETNRIEQVARIAEQLTQERIVFLQSIESEVAKLSLSIAGRILRREAQVDPLLLTGAVRVALGQLADTTVVRLRVPEPEFQLWSETLKHLPGLKMKPVVIADETMQAGEATLESELGSADLGIESQLNEIRQGFLDVSGVAAVQRDSVAKKDELVALR